MYASIAKKQKRDNLDRAFKKLTRGMEKRNGPFDSLFVKKFTRTELDNSLKKCKLGKAPGPDEVTSDTLIQLSEYDKAMLLKIINKTWDSGSLPQIWKTANIVPILKNGKPKNKVSSYRPISLTSCISKVAERMINARLYHWLEKMENSIPTKQALEKADKQLIN